MREFFFPTKLGRLNYAIRAIPLNLIVLDVSARPELHLSNNNDLILYAAGIVALLGYLIFFVTLPRVRDCGWPWYSLLLSFVPFLSTTFAFLLLFKPTQSLILRKRLGEQSAAPPVMPTVAGSVCARCNKRLLLASDGVVSPARDVVCNECNAEAAASPA